MKKNKDKAFKYYHFLLFQTNSEGVNMKELYFSYLAILRKVANHVALLQCTAGTSKQQVETRFPITDLLYLFLRDASWTGFPEWVHTMSSSDGFKSLLYLICFFQEKYVGGICAKVFQRFPDFVQRCKDEAFEALSDPMYSGKMKVEFGNNDLLVIGCFPCGFIYSICLPLQVLQKLLKYYLQKRDKVLLFSLSTKVRSVCLYWNLSSCALVILHMWLQR